MRSPEVDCMKRLFRKCAFPLVRQLRESYVPHRDWLKCSLAKMFSVRCFCEYGASCSKSCDACTRELHFNSKNDMGADIAKFNPAEDGRKPNVFTRIGHLRS